jgi:hypothetical protein
MTRCAGTSRIERMNAMEPRETLLCIGGPLSTKRLSVPAGLQRFTLEKACAVENTGGFIALESLRQVVGEGHVYERKQFVSGEDGITEVFTLIVAPSRR